MTKRPTKKDELASMQRSRIPATNCIQAYFHCGNCLGDRPPTMSPAEWVRLEAGFTPAGLQVRCQRCDLNIAHIDFEGMRHPANTAARDDEPTSIN